MTEPPMSGPQGAALAAKPPAAEPEVRIRLDLAEHHAETLAAAMRPHCLRVQVAGSIRRRRADVGDLEIVAIPTWEDDLPPGHLLPVPVNRLHEWALRQELEGADRGKAWKARFANGMRLDLFLVTPDSWGIQLAIRTGAATFSRALVERAREVGLPCHGGYLRDGDDDGPIIPTPEERVVFELLKLRWLPPEARFDDTALWRAAR
jgi:DNA polymerase/3'-5' exonuclease PolX